MKANVTFIGGEGDGDVRRTTWGAGSDAVEFVLNEPVELDSQAPKVGQFHAHIIAKAKRNRFFKVEMIDEKKKPDEKKAP